VLNLRSDDLLVRLDPAHGGEVLDLVDLATGRQLLGRPPFATALPRAGDLDEATWTAGYRGGWQCVTPNAGNACEVDGVAHGFHGRASADRWEVVDATAGSATLAWAGHGLHITRRYALEDGALVATTRWEAEAGPAPFIHLEHVTAGLEVLEPETLIRLPGGRAHELSESDGPAVPPAAAPDWPEVLLLDGRRERGDRLSLARRHARYLAVTDLPAGSAEVVNRRTGAGLALAWDADVLPHLWIWHEVRATGGHWRRQAEILGIEPCSVPHGLGLAAALEHEQASWARPGAPVELRIAVRPLRA
jgi:hypothetical protein